MEFIVQLKNLDAFAVEFWNRYNTHKIFAFQGQMGAGKTTIIKELCRFRGVHSSMGSPTFSIINEYITDDGSIFHLDLYRLNSVREAIDAGVEELINSDTTCFIEWPEKALDILPNETLWISIEIIDSETRKLTIGDEVMN